MKAQIRLGNEDDIKTAYKLMREAFEEYRVLEIPSSAIDEPVDFLLNSFKNGTEKVILCLVNGIPLGSSRFTLREDSLYFSRVSVPPYARGRGLAKSMLSWLENHAEE
ncbi:GNAT family N-acetyltransferase [Peribacillus deserti]